MDLQKDSFENAIVEKIGKYEKTFRDPIFGDISLNRLEVELVDTSDFQRLHSVKQLGSTYLVFSGALHSRFLHSLGVLFMTDFIIRRVGENQYPIRVFDDDYWLIVTRAAALLHDLPCIAFSHTLDDVGNLFQKQWKNLFRVKQLFGHTSDIRKKIRDLLSQISSQEKELSNVKLISEYTDKKSHAAISKGLIEDLLDNMLSDIVKINCSDCSDGFLERALGKVKGKLDKDRIRVSRDIVGNTICADLLDYIRRDFECAGIDKNYDRRFLSYAVIDDNWNFAFRIYKPKAGELKPSVISQLLNLLDLRYELAESVHFHKTKIMFSAMIIEAVNFTLQEKFYSDRERLEKDIWKFGDDGLLSYLEKNGVESSKRIIGRLRRREKYDAVREYGEILTQRREPIESFARYEMISDGIREILRNPWQRYQIEQGIVDWLSHNETQECVENSCEAFGGDILIYCPRSYDKLYKELDVRIIPKPERNAVTLRELSIEHLGRKQAPSHLDSYLFNRISKKRDGLIESYRNLWRARIFIFRECKDLALEIMRLFDYIMNKFYLIDVERSKYAPAFLPAGAQKYLNELSSQSGRLDGEKIPTMEDMLG